MQIPQTVKAHRDSIRITVGFSACQRSLANMRAIWYNRGKREQSGEEEWNSGSRITGETW